MSNLTRPEVEIALNVLADMKAENPVLHRQLQRLLPALAIDFADAGKLVDEVVLKSVLMQAIENGQAPESLFSRPPKHEALTYKDVARRLNSRFQTGHVYTIEDAIRFGMMGALRRHAEKQKLPQTFIAAQAAVAAANGHYELLRFFIERSSVKGLMIGNAISNAIGYTRQQLHIVDHLIEDYYADYDSVIREAVNSSFKDGAHSNYSAFKRLREKFQDHEYPAECFSGIEGWQNITVRMGEYLKVRSMMQYEDPSVQTRNQVAFKAVMIFQSAERVLRYLDRWGTPSSAPLKSVIEELQAPMAQTGIDWNAWGDALLKFGPQLGFMLNYAAAVPSPIYNKKGEISLRLTREHVWKTCYPNKNKDLKLAQLCFNLERKNDHFERALKIWSERTLQDAEAQHSIPDISFECSSLGLPGYTLERISYEDQRIMFLGDYTGCCERVGYQFEDTIHHALTTRESAYYVLKHNDDIMLHTWMWRGEGGQLIIDGYESDDPNIDTETLVSLTQKIADILSQPIHEEFGITDIILGVSNKSFSPELYFPAAREAATRFVCEYYYYETPEQWLVKRLEKPSKYKFIALDDPYKPEMRHL